MLFTPESVRQRCAEIARECDAGKITQLEAGTQIAETDPDSGVGYLLQGNALSAAGNLAGAESCFWKALDRAPCHYGVYMALSEIHRATDKDDSLAERLILLAVWKLALDDEIPDEVAKFFRERWKLNPDLHFDDPIIYEAMAITLEKATETGPELRNRLLPYELLNELQQQSTEVVDARVLREILEHAERVIPVFRGALREWTERDSSLSPDALAMVIALLGETAAPEIIDELLELVDYNERPVFLHANWAVWRLGQRFPAEALARFRAATTGAWLTLRCVLAEQIFLLPDTPGIEAGLLELLEGFDAFAGEEDAPYLLAMVIESLNDLGREDEAEKVFERWHRFLPKAARKWVRDGAAEGRMSKPIDEEVAGFTIEKICLDRVLLEDEDSEEEDDDEYYEDEDEDEDEEITPAVAAVKPGRNEPCWCGSGKKYKKCHLVADEEAERDHRAPRAERPAEEETTHAKLQRLLMEYSLDRRSADDFAKAILLYFDERAEHIDFKSDRERFGGFLEWYIHDFRPSSAGHTLLEEYLRRRGGRLSAAERAVLESWCAARFGIREVERVDKGKGVLLRDLFEGGRFFVDDVSCSNSLIRWDCVLSRIYESEGKWYFVGNGLRVPRSLMPLLTEQIERESREAGESTAAFVRANSHRWHRVIDELAQERLTGLRVLNAEGDELEFSAAEYRIDNESALLSALEAAEPFETARQDDPGVRSFAWLEEGAGESRRSYGNIQIRNGKLRLECNSRQRLAIGRKLVEQHGGAWLRHVRDSFESLDELKRKAGGKAQPKKGPGSGLPPEVERELVQKVKSEHYARWVDEPLPALDGRTPREATGSEDGRRALEDLLRMMENNEEHARLQGGVAFDFSIVRKSLGM